MIRKSFNQNSLKKAVIFSSCLLLLPSPGQAAELLKEIHGYRPVMTLDEANDRAAHAQEERMPPDERAAGRATELSNEESKVKENAREGAVQSNAELQLTPSVETSSESPVLTE